MAAYGALVSLMHIIDTLRKHPSPPISIHPKQADSLTEKVTFLENFLEIYNPHLDYSKEADPLESSIADAAYAAEDIIESHIVYHIKTDGGKTSPNSLYKSLEKVIGYMGLIEKEAMEIKQTLGVKHQLHTKSAPSDSSESSTNADDKITMVGAEEALLEMKDKLTSDRRDLQIIPIVGMGGSGKTTLAMNIYQDRLVKEHFHVSAWVAISQEYNIQEMLVHILRQLNQKVGQTSSEEGLGEILHKNLFGRKYLIILDDMWSIKAWDGIRRFLPDNKNGSRIVVTTRLSNLGSDLSHSKNFEMRLLNVVDGWKLLSKIVFGEKVCPPELVKIGWRIVFGCKGLPLSIVVIGGLLTKSNHTREIWWSIQENLSSIVNSNDDEWCFRILHMSYKQLPVYLKPCFLYMGIFGEDKVIRRSTLIKLWVSEGILKPKSGKSLEEIAKVYLKDLADRNLVLINKIGINGEIKCCKIHDLVRDMCLKEVEKERFYHVIRDDLPRLNTPRIKSQRRVIIPRLLSSLVLGSFSYARSLICDYDDYGEVRLPHNLRLLRTLKAYDVDTDIMNGAYFFDNVFELVNLRYLAVRVHPGSKFSTSIDLLWNLHTLTIRCSRGLIAPNEIWKLHQLRHLEFTQYRLSLPEPPIDDNDIVIMENLHTLKGVKNLVLNEKVVKRIPNVKKLYLWYNIAEMKGNNYLSNLECLSKLENFHCYLNNAHDVHWQGIRFPHSLKKLSVIVAWSAHYALNLEDIMSEISSLPLLEKLVLNSGVFKTSKWETIEGQFPSLKFLHLESCYDLVDWIVSDNSHFPHLRGLHLRGFRQLKEIPSAVGEIATLKSIELESCSESAVRSAKKIVEEQEDLYGDQLDLHVRVKVYKDQEKLKSLATANFEFV
ncbi:putative late blight resistance protein homolog R1A-3 [Salvia hispanica]|uniref:putative late blight resistance protein homolog R1A-3 n=1 Tax=Salvia hispanica TaxID=49212 RepID=UPI0020093A43|nr:putative late blight resistance protein homolog R1A-3 [Salvia hispanica]XP_047957438.1 putative late blight resistance protein homolog R1A-3 [Salvia hispanica]